MTSEFMEMYCTKAAVIGRAFGPLFVCVFFVCINYSIKGNLLPPIRSFYGAFNGYNIKVKIRQQFNNEMGRTH